MGFLTECVVLIEWAGFPFPEALIFGFRFLLVRRLISKRPYSAAFCWLSSGGRTRTDEAAYGLWVDHQRRYTPPNVQGVWSRIWEFLFQPSWITNTWTKALVVGQLTKPQGPHGRRRTTTSDVCEARKCQWKSMCLDGPWRTMEDHPWAAEVISREKQKKKVGPQKGVIC